MQASIYRCSMRHTKRFEVFSEQHYYGTFVYIRLFNIVFEFDLIRPNQRLETLTGQQDNEKQHRTDAESRRSSPKDLL